MKKILISFISICMLLIPTSVSARPIKETPVNFEQVVIEKASQYIGTRYCRGGESPRCFDCSGLTQYVYAQIGIELPRMGGQQLKSMKRVSAEEAQPGDLVFFSTKRGYIYHVGIYIGDGKMIHSPKPGQRVKIAPVFKNPIYATLPTT